VATAYEIVIQGHLDRRWAGWFEGMTLTHREDGTTCLYGPIVDQSALYGILSRMRDLNLELISVQQHIVQEDDSSSGRNRDTRYL
jgi:hypothetical protein